MNQEINNQNSVFAYSAAKKSNPTLLPPCLLMHND